MKKFFKDLLSNGDAVSSKRVISLFVLVNLIILTYISTLHSQDKTTPEFMFESLSLIVGGGLGFTVIEKIFRDKDKPGDNTPLE